MAPKQAIPFGLKLPAETEVATKRFIAEVLDPQIDELLEQAALLQAHRRALAASFGVDRRRDGVGGLIDGANRLQHEGGEEQRQVA